MSSALKHRWSVENNFLLGITAGRWWRLLRENRFAVDPAYWHRAAVITLASLFNWLDARNEERFYAEAVRGTVVERPPLFILGHPRTGTTHLHNLVTLDPQFGFPNVYQVTYPHSFLSTEERRSRQFASHLPSKRLMDNVSLGADRPHEDEFALAISSLYSPMLAVNFPRHGEKYRRYLTFEGVPAEELEEWKRTMRWFVKKLTLKQRRRLVLKSPQHTARIRLLLELFPEACFVNIHREPYTVFSSWRYALDKAVWFLFLQKPPAGNIDEDLLRDGKVIFDAYFDQRHLVPPGRLVDVAYEDLEARPVGVMREIYEKLGLAGFEALRPRLQAYLDTLQGYRKNLLPELAPDVKANVNREWRRAFDEWGYRA